MKVCSTCKENKPYSEYHKDKSNKTGRAFYCKSCAKIKSIKWYNNHNTIEYRTNRTAQGRAIRLEVKQKAVILLGNKCHDCGNQYPMSVYDFHHVDPDTKDLTIGKHKIWGTRLQAELKKCILLCANCHRIRHFEGNNG